MSSSGTNKTFSKIGIRVCIGDPIANVVEIVIDGVSAMIMVARLGLRGARGAAGSEWSVDQVG